MKSWTDKYKDGGALPPEDAAIAKVLMERGRGKNFVDRAFNNDTAPKLQTNKIPGYNKVPNSQYSTELMAYDTNNDGTGRVYPEIVQKPWNAGLTYLGGDKAYDYAGSTGEYITTPSWKIADMLSNKGYKKATGIPVYKDGGNIPSWLDQYRTPQNSAVDNTVGKRPAPVSQVQEDEIKKIGIIGQSRKRDELQHEGDIVKARQRLDSDYKYNDWREKAHDHGLSLEGKSRIFENKTDVPDNFMGALTDVIDDNLNPIGWVGKMASALAKAPKESADQNSVMPYVSAIGTPLVAGMMGFDPLGSGAHHVSNFTKVATNEIEPIINAYRAVKGMKTTKPLTNVDIGALKDSRVVGSIFNDAGEQTKRFGQILNQSKNISDEQLQSLTGMSRNKMQEYIANYKPEELPENAVATTAGNISLRRPIGYRRQPSVTFEEAPQRDLQGGTENWQDGYIIPDVLPEPPQYLEINTTNRGRTLIPGMLSKRKFELGIGDAIADWYTKKGTKDLMPKVDMPVTESLLPGLYKSGNNNPSAEILKAYRKFQSGESGQTFIPAHSLSTDSYPMSLSLMERALKNDAGTVNYHGHQLLNNMGFPTKAGLNGASVKEINSIIDRLSTQAGKKIPYAYKDTYGIKAPELTVTKKEYGGSISWTDKYK